MDLTKIPSRFQFPIKDFIRRDDYILTIENYLISNKIIFIEGDSDVGKTTINLSFCAKNKKNTISIFFNPLNKIDYQLEFFLNNAISQLRLYLGEDFNKKF